MRADADRWLTFGPAVMTTVMEHDFGPKDDLGWVDEYEWEDSEYTEHIGPQCRRCGTRWCTHCGIFRQEPCVEPSQSGRADGLIARAVEMGPDEGFDLPGEGADLPRWKVDPTQSGREENP